jgi:hypothetical protein
MQTVHGSEGIFDLGVISKKKYFLVLMGFVFIKWHIGQN